MLNMVTWIPSIYPSHVSIYTSTMDPMGNDCTYYGRFNMDPKNNDHLLVSTVLVGLLTKNGQLAGLMFILFGIATTLSSKGCFSTRAVWHGDFPSHLHPLFSCRGHQNRDPAKQGNVCGSGKKGVSPTNVVLYSWLHGRSCFAWYWWYCHNMGWLMYACTV